MSARWPVPPPITRKRMLRFGTICTFCDVDLAVRDHRIWCSQTEHYSSLPTH